MSTSRAAGSVVHVTTAPSAEATVEHIDWRSITSVDETLRKELQHSDQCTLMTLYQFPAQLWPLETGWSWSWSCWQTFYHFEQLNQTCSVSPLLLYVW